MIDAHHHLWDLAAREHRWLMGGQPWATDAELARLRRSFTLGDLAALTAASGVTGTVVVQTVAEPWETPDLLALAEAGGLLAGVVGWTDLTAPDAADAVAGDLRPYYETVLAAFGPDRLLFGSDWPVSTLAAPYGQVCEMYRELTAQLSAAEQHAIFDHTARRVYGLR